MTYKTIKDIECQYEKEPYNRAIVCEDKIEQNNKSISRDIKSIHALTEQSLFLLISKEQYACSSRSYSTIGILCDIIKDSSENEGMKDNLKTDLMMIAEHLIIQKSRLDKYVREYKEGDDEWDELTDGEGYDT
tara:strand:+ start:1743 stop:2141 length:399 start_codon:yes stop_codon:yes gene_type:complete